MLKFGNLELPDNSNLNKGNNKISESFKHSNSGFSNKSNLKAKSISSEINVIGKNVEDAIFIIDKYLDDAFLANLQVVRIVHGKGTGKLREGIHSFLRKNSHVENFRIGTYGEGEMGVTIVELKK